MRTAIEDRRKRVTVHTGEDPHSAYMGNLKSFGIEDVPVEGGIFIEEWNKWGKVREFGNICQLVRLGTHLLSRGVPKGATAVLRETVAKAPANAQAWHLLAIAFYQQGLDDEALRASFQAIRLNPGISGEQNLHGLILVELNRPKEARDAFAEALRLDPGSLLARKNLTAILDELGRKEEADRLRSDGPSLM